MLITIKLIVYYQMRQESYIFLFKEGREQMTKREQKL